MVLLVFWAGVLWGRIHASTSTSLTGRYLDVMASWWKLHVSYRSEAVFLADVFAALGVPVTFLSDSDVPMVVASVLGLGAASLPTLAGISSRYGSGALRIQARGRRDVFGETRAIGT